MEGKLSIWMDVDTDCFATAIVGTSCPPAFGSLYWPLPAWSGGLSRDSQFPYSRCRNTVWPPVTPGLPPRGRVTLKSSRCRYSQEAQTAVPVLCPPLRQRPYFERLVFGGTENANAAASDSLIPRASFVPGWPPLCSPLAGARV